MKLAVLAATVGALVAAYVAASAPAGNRNPSTFTFAADPGPSKITFGKSVVYKGTYSNPGKSNWLRVTFSQEVPYANINTSNGAAKLPAKLVYSSCAADHYNPPAVTGDTYSCPTIDVLPAGSEIKHVTLAWESQVLPANATCVSPCQLATRAILSIKESNPSSNDTFFYPPAPARLTTTLLEVPETAEAGGYPITTCSPTGEPTLVTNQSVNSTTNPMSTSVCVPSLPQNLDGFNPGLVVRITERGANKDETNGFTQVSQICIPDTGLTCPDSGPYTPFTFPGTLATFVFVFDSKAYTKKITKMYDNNVLVTSTDPGDDPNCTIVYDNPNGRTIATCHSSKNGPWRGG